MNEYSASSTKPKWHADALGSPAGTPRRPGGWMVRASVLGGTVRTFYVYEIDDKKAAEMARIAIPAINGEMIETVKLVDIHELEGHGLKRADVKQYG